MMGRCFIVVVVLLITLGIGGFLGYCVGEQATRTEAIKAGAGEWVLPDNSKPRPEFQWKPERNPNERDVLDENEAG